MILVLTLFRFTMKWTFFLTLITYASSQFIQIKNQGYEGILISIHKDVPEDFELIENIQNYFTKASELLYQATNKSVYFSNITIEVPMNWSTRSIYETIDGANMFKKASFRIAKPNPQYLNRMYTLQTGGCGKPGQYVHITPEALKNKTHTEDSLNGDIVKQIVHEWSHLRYGVFDEYGETGSDRYTTFYIDDDGKIRPTSCHANIKGWTSTKEGAPCNIIEGELLPDDDCIFIPDIKGNKFISSLMYSTYIPSIEKFCNNKTETKHNTKAPNKHNTLCNYQSVWDVILKHEDFGNLRNFKNVASTKPTFRIIHRRKHEKTKFLLALDVSSSMTIRDRILKLREAAIRFINHFLKDDSYLGILSFSNYVEQLLAMTKANRYTKKLMVQSLPRETYCKTAIGKALTEAIEIIKRSNLSPDGAVLILITDGEENERPSINQVLEKVIASRMIVNTIGIGSRASKQLENLSKQTGGKVFYLPENQPNPTLLDEAFITISMEHSEEDVDPVMITSESLPANIDSSFEGQVIIDDDIGRNTKFIFTGKYIDNVDIKLISPSGKIHDEDSDESSSNTRAFSIPDAEAGIWKYTLRGGQNDVDIFVTSEAQTFKEPIQIRTWIENSEIEYPSRAVIYAYVFRDFQPIINTEVYAIVTGPNGQKVNVTLSDDGSDPDIEANDGVYTAFFVDYKGDGRYSVSVVALNDGKATYVQRAQLSKAPKVPSVTNMDELMKTSPKNAFEIESFTIGTRRWNHVASSIPNVAKFKRTATTGSFKVQKWKNDSNSFLQPSRVTNLNAVYVQSNEQNNGTRVKLSWTVPSHKKAMSKELIHDLRVSWSQEHLLNDFNNAYRIEPHDITNGTIKSSRRYSNVIIVSLDGNNIPSNDGRRMNLYFSVKYLTPEGKTSDVSNIPYVTLGIKRVKLVAPSSLETEEMPKVVGIVAGSIFLTLLICVVFLVLFRHCRKDNSNDDVER